MNTHDMLAAAREVVADPGFAVRIIPGEVATAPETAIAALQAVCPRRDGPYVQALRTLKAALDEMGPGWRGDTDSGVVAVFDQAIQMAEEERV